jgi:hypothetical protein
MTQRDSGVFTRLGCGFSLFAVFFFSACIVLFLKVRKDPGWDGAASTEGSILTISPSTAYQYSDSPKLSRGPVRVEFEYRVGGETFHQTQSISSGSSFYIGQSVPIIYLPDKPLIAKIPNAEPQDTVPLFVIAMFAVLALLGIVPDLFERLLAARKKQKRKEKPKI